MPYTTLSMSGVNYNNKLVMLFFIALLMLNFPILRIFGEEKSLFGIPILYLYLFFTWLVIIFMIFWFSKPKQNKD